MSKGEATHLSTHHLPSMHCCWLLNRTGKEKQTLWVSVMVTLSMYNNNEHFFQLLCVHSNYKAQRLLLINCSMYHTKWLKIRCHMYFGGWGSYLLSLPQSREMGARYLNVTANFIRPNGCGCCGCCSMNIRPCWLNIIIAAAPIVGIACTGWLKT